MLRLVGGQGFFICESKTEIIFGSRFSVDKNKDMTYSLGHK